MRTDQCGYCRSTNIDHEEHTGFDPVFTSHCCADCGAYNLEERPARRATEEEMATGWYQNGEDYVLSSPFTDKPCWTPKTRTHMRLWALEIGMPK